MTPDAYGGLAGAIPDLDLSAADGFRRSQAETPGLRGDTAAATYEQGWRASGALKAAGWIRGEDVHEQHRGWTAVVAVVGGGKVPRAPVREGEGEVGKVGAGAE